MAVIHIVLFKLLNTLHDAEINTFCNDMLSLSTKCVHPTSGKPYILSSSGGKDNSPEGLQGGFTHGFVVEFASAEDRDYYVSHDPAHQAFIKDHSPDFDDVRVVDYTKAEF